jgi:hypothetical protein
MLCFGLPAALLVPSASASTSSIVDRLSTGKTAVEVVSLPPGTGLVKVAVMKNLAGEGVSYKVIPGTQASFTATAVDPVVDLQAATSTGAPIGKWAGRLLTVQPHEETKEEREAREGKEREAREKAEREAHEREEREKSSASVADRLSTSRSAVEVVSLPRGAGLVKIAVMKNFAGEGVSYKMIPATQVSFTPTAADPVVDMQAATGAGVPIGSWAGRLLTSQSHEETSEEREARERKEREAREREEREAREKEEREKSGSSMWVGLDAGGWDWSSAVRDVAGAVKYLRASYSYYNSDAQMSLLAENHLTLLPLFSGGGSIGAINRGEYANTMVAWFKRYGHGGTFWAGRTDYGARTAEVLNEPGNPYFWSDPNNFAAYAGLAKAVHDAFEANFAPAVRASVICSYDGGYAGDSWGRNLFSAELEAAKACDGLDVHPYGGHGSSSALGNRPRVTEAHADTGKPVYVTEVGWPTAVGQPPTGDSLQWTEAQQAANIRDFVLWSRSLTYVKAVIYFNYADYGSNNWYGIVRSSGSPHKLSYSTLQSLTAEG